jgi:predicted  nucleic acid-binding Zn-ribbon protein
VDAGIEDNALLMEGNKSLLAECNALHKRSEDLEAELAKARTSVTEDITALEARIKSIEAHTMDVAAAVEKCVSDFETELIKDLAELHALYERNIETIGGLCSPMPDGTSCHLG